MHQISGIDLSRFSKILNTHILFFADQNLIKLNFMICLYRFVRKGWVFRAQLTVFDLSVHGLGCSARWPGTMLKSFNSSEFGTAPFLDEIKHYVYP